MFLKSKNNRFNRLVFTPLGSRVMLPHFGSRIHELVDEDMGLVWKIKLKKYLYECFFNENLKLWDKEFEPIEIKIVDVNVKQGEMSVSLKFKNKIEISLMHRG